MKKLFTLIELIVVIVVLGILAAIVIPNVSSFKKEAIRSEIASNIKNLQTATDRYALNNNGQKPTILKASANDPQRLASEKLFPGYISKKESDRGFYWVDYNGQVWGSTIDAPNRIVYEDAKLSWTAVPGAQSYQIYGVKDVDVKGSLNEKYYRYTPLKKAENSENKLVLNEENLNANGYDYLLVSAVDQYGFETVPSGEEYIGYPNQDDDGNYLPIQKEGTFYLTTNANGMATWDAIVTKEVKPEGTEIRYSFSTSNDGETYTPYISKIEDLPKSQYMTVKVELIGSNGKVPTLQSLEVKSHLDGEISKVSNHPFTVSNEDNYQEIIQMPESGYFRDVILEEETMSSGETVRVKYQSSTDGINFSEPTYYPEELPPGEFIQITIETDETITFHKVTVIQTNADPNVVPLDEIAGEWLSGPVTTPSNPSGSNGGGNSSTPTTEEWIQVDYFEIIEDAKAIADWISVDKSDALYEGNRITYEFQASNDKITWGPVNLDPSLIQDSRYFKVKVTLEKLKDAPKEPSVDVIAVNYLVNGETKIGMYMKQEDGTMKRINSGESLGFLATSGDAGRDNLDGVIESSDGNYVAVGQTYKGATMMDAAIVKYSEDGNLVWSKSYGGTGNDALHSLIETPDGGFVAVGETRSFDGDLEGSTGTAGFLIAKFDKDGNKEWMKGYPNPIRSTTSILNSVELTEDGGIIAVGSASGGDIQGISDVVLMKFDMNGTRLWSKQYGGPNFDYLVSIDKTRDGNYITAGYSRSTGGDLNISNKGGEDMLLVKFDPSGNVLWAKNYGGSDNDRFSSVVESSDGNYVAVGETVSRNGDFTTIQRYRDYTIGKFTPQGEKIWLKKSERYGDDRFYAVQATSDGGFVGVGETEYAASFTTRRGLKDVLLMKFDTNGAPEWDSTYGGSHLESLYGVNITSDGGVVAVGYSESPSSTQGEIKENSGGMDFLIVKTKPSGRLE